MFDISVIIDNDILEIATFISKIKTEIYIKYIYQNFFFIEFIFSDISTKFIHSPQDVTSSIKFYF